MSATEQLQQLDKEVLIDRHLRLVADHRRVVQRAGDERLQARLEERRRVLSSFLSVADDLERGLASADGATDNPWCTGMHAIERELEKTFRENGVERMAVSEGEPFNPERHEALSTVAGSGLADGAVARVVCAGFVMGDDVLRVARVVVARAPTASPTGRA